MHQRKEVYFRIIFPWEYTLNRYNKNVENYCIGPCIYIQSVSLRLNNLNNPLNVIKSVKCTDMSHVTIVNIKRNNENE